MVEAAAEREGVNEVEEKKAGLDAKETLEKQLRLLSERSENADADSLPRLSAAMCEIARVLLDNERAPIG